VRVEPATAVAGALAVPGTKSIAHRALLIGALAVGESEIRGLGRSGDVDSTIGALRALGVDVAGQGETVTVTGVGLRGLEAPAEPIDLGNSGTSLRLLAGILAGQEGRFVLAGDESLSRRPHERVAEPLRLMGAHVETTAGGAPVTIHGGALSRLRYELPVASAQVKSAVLFAGLLAGEGPTTVVEPTPTRDHTERMLAAAGARVERRPGLASVWPATSLRPLDLEVPGDFSSAAPFLVAATLLSGSQLRVAGVNINPTRIGFLHVLERMGARISLYNRRTLAGEPAADIEIGAAELTATGIEPEEVPSLVDELPLFALAASLARGESVVRGAAELRAKETDRIETTTAALRTLGAHIRETPDGFRIRGVPTRLRGGRIDSHGDHRIAMLGGVAGLLSKEGVEIENAEAAAVSFPDFFAVLNSVAVK
jgi:3-phosphoshikimate 1-carboxyvinyltransferase